MRTKTRVHEGEITVTSSTPTQVESEVVVEVLAANVDHNLEAGLRQAHVTCAHGGIYTGAGLGSPWIVLEWKGKQARIHAIDVLAAWVKTFNEADAKRLLESK